MKESSATSDQDKNIESRPHIVLGRSSSEIVVKRSRFIATVCEIHSEKDAASLIAGLRKQFWDARHNCYAYVLGEKAILTHSSDDKEPAGTAGRPILDAIIKSGHTNTLIVVTRYFGGILLGTGGLARAYSLSASEGLKAADSFPLSPGNRITINCTYSDSGRLMHLTEEYNAPLIDSSYDEAVTLTVLSEKDHTNALIKKITEASKGKASVVTGDDIFYYVSDGRASIYEF